MATTSTSPKTDLVLSNIQGNIIGGFNKDFQDFVYLKFRSDAAGRAWLAKIADDDEVGIASSTADQVLKFNAQFKALAVELKDRFPSGKVKPENFIQAEWTSLSISFAGLKALGVQQGSLDAMPAEFAAGMKSRATVLNDQGDSDPLKWEAPFDGDVHALLLVAADDEAKLGARLANIRASNEYKAGVQELLPAPLAGRVRHDAGDAQIGHEHFGFKDGVSQPAIRGIDQPFDPIANPNQAQPGRDLLWGGLFVVGYATQDPTSDPLVDGPNPTPKNPIPAQPSWTADGSYLVFRKLAQNVAGFDAQVSAIAAERKWSEDLVGAKMVGRFKSGCPLETRKFQPGAGGPPLANIKDPGAWPAPTSAHPNPGPTPITLLADSDNLNLNFEFNDLDPVGAICPMSSHIRKVYPRDEVVLDASPEGIDNSESDTQTHRILRRGIPYGGSFNSAKGGGKDDPRGLIFQCYQSSIKFQFEFVQQSWVNEPNFPPHAVGGVPGEDPIIAQSDTGPFQFSPDDPTPTIVTHFVTTKGGEYFFTPSLSTLKELGAGQH
jgi:Dyp-type peroxidase family